MKLLAMHSGRKGVNKSNKNNVMKITTNSISKVLFFASFLTENFMLYITGCSISECVFKRAKNVRKSICRSHMSGALDGTEKSKAQKLGHPMLVQLILSQKNQKSKFFNEQFFCN